MAAKPAEDSNAFAGQVIVWQRRGRSAEATWIAASNIT
jgi:hypothetical protein